ncbi:MAG: putative cytochrome c peroxidase precursor [Bacteroidetes bacterium]|nr:putative cytochrome c peroxidase precursor [Bacteroidota bacterium]
MKIKSNFIAVSCILVTCTMLLSFSSRKDEALLAAPPNDTLKLVVPKGWPKPVYDFTKNPITREGFELGRKLFYDPVLSQDSTISCSSCHLQYTNFTHVDHALSHGIKGLKGTRNTLSIINAAWTKNFMWDGGINNIEVQPLAPIQSPVEMNSSLNIILPRLNKQEYYKKKFKLAFGKDAEINSQNFLKALAQYMLSLQSFNSKYDQVMRKEAGVAFTEPEKRGLKLFRKKCASCHAEPLFTNNEYENNGLAVDTMLKDGGRAKITHLVKDSLKFRVPSLRNVELSYQYMHDGRYRNLQMVLFHYNHSISNTINLSPKLKEPMNFSEQDKNDVIAFLKTLTDEEFLHNPKYFYQKD